MKFHEKRLLSCPFERVNTLSTKKMWCDDGNFLLAETEVVMTTLISSHVNDKNCIFTGYEIFVTGNILLFHRYLITNSTLIVSSTRCLIRLLRSLLRYRVEHSKRNSISPRAIYYSLFVFSKGSIVTEFKLIFNAKDEPKAFEMLKEEIKDGNLGTLRVDPSSLVRLAQLNSTTKGDFKRYFYFLNLYI